MANINKNLLVKGARGNVGKQFVYRRHGNNTIIGSMPTVNPDAAPSEEQAEARELFSAANAYAQGAISSADLKKEYQRKAPPGKSAFNMAMRDFMKPPVVKKINTSEYNGTPGSKISIHAKDDFRVAEVKVGIYTADGTLLEEGNAILNPINRLLWTYTATVANASPAGSVIRAMATDLPGNTALLEILV
ncbi:hypothetical protein [Chitinophaga barathri]|uniref:Uncharacterized protein n=1 Tax=Chitinophaga barathri TaxID=1647451 RepID=A0A3N4MC64_9BACT|nr:hypothetical protein [Chitinophaga barathri]RPD41472.1 hypothetical protein EG028_09130 [Chitinophaga barathri]